MSNHKPKSKWSADVTEHSDALDLKPDVFENDDPKAIAASLKRSAEASHRRKSNPYPLGDVDADLLHQPGGLEPAGGAQAGARGGQG